MVFVVDIKIFIVGGKDVYLFGRLYVMKGWMSVNIVILKDGLVFISVYLVDKVVYVIWCYVCFKGIFVY